MIKVVFLVGIKVVWFINEFIVVVMVYGFYKKEWVFNVMVVDLGGGILDVLLFNI